MSNSYRIQAENLGHKNEQVLDSYDNVKKTTLGYKNDQVSELDIIYFLENILWSANFELIAQIIVDSGYESRLDQWKEAIIELNK